MPSQERQEESGGIAFPRAPAGCRQRARARLPSGEILPSRKDSFDISKNPGGNYPGKTLLSGSSASIFATGRNTLLKTVSFRIAMKTISINLPDDLLARIDYAAGKRGETRSAVLREALEEFFSKEKSRNAGSCLDHARDLAGCVQGPPDLSTNPAHMDHCGR